MYKNIESFLERNRVGLILRAYEVKPEGVPKRIEMLERSINAAQSVHFGKQQAVRHINIMVWEDETNYPGQVDCGLLAPELSNHFKNRDGVHIGHLKHGDEYCAILNRAVALQAQSRCRYSIIASSEAYSYWNEHTVGRMMQAAVDGALAVGLAINELQESIMQGRIANTFAMWKSLELLTVGGFDLRAAKPTGDKRARVFDGMNPVTGEPLEYHLSGVEEMIPLARLVKNHGACIAPVMPVDKDGNLQHYELPEDRDLLVRHFNKMGTKKERQGALLAGENVDPSFLLGGVMKKYRKIQPAA